MIVYHAAYYHHPEEGWYTARVLDFPAVLTQGRTIEQARLMLCDALREMSGLFIEQGKALPKPVADITDPKASHLEAIELRLSGRAVARS